MNRKLLAAVEGVTIWLAVCTYGVVVAVYVARDIDIHLSRDWVALWIIGGTFVPLWVHLVFKIKIKINITRR
jgi:hypothetical protein